MNRTILCINRHGEGKVNKVFQIIVVCLFRHSVMLDDTDVCKFRHSVMLDDTDVCKFRHCVMLDDTDTCKFRCFILCFQHYQRGQGRQVIHWQPPLTSALIRSVFFGMSVFFCVKKNNFLIRSALFLFFVFI